MQLEIEPGLLEEAVFRELRRREEAGDPAPARTYRETLDPLYELPPDDDRRPTGFAAAALAAFRDLGLHAWLEQQLAAFPLLERLDRLALQPPRGKVRGGDAELFVAHGARPQRTAVLTITPESFTDLERLGAFLQRELLRLQDMLDPAFGYEPRLPGAAEDPLRANLQRDRYRLLWESHIEGRLARGGNPPAALCGLYERAFPELDPIRRGALLAWAYGAPRLTHSELAACSTRGDQPA